MDALEELQLTRWVRAAWLREEDLRPYGERRHAEVLLARVLTIDVAQSRPPLVVDGVLLGDPAEAFRAIQEFEHPAHAQALVEAALRMRLLTATEGGLRIHLSPDLLQVAQKVRRYLLGLTIKIGNQRYNKNEGHSLATAEGNEF